MLAGCGYTLAIAIASAAAAQTPVPDAAGSTSKHPTPAMATAATEITAPVIREPRRIDWGRSVGDGPWTQSTLFGGNKDIHHGGFGGASIRGTELLGRTSIFVGGRGAWQANHGIFVGGAGYGLATEHDAPAAVQVAGEPRRKIQVGYAGLWMGYTILSHALVHPVLSVLIGAGGAAYEGRDAVSGELLEIETDVFFIAEPELEMEINVLPFMRLAVGLAYRVARSVDMTGIDQDEVSKLLVTSDIRFGRF